MRGTLHLPPVGDVSPDLDPYSELHVQEHLEDVTAPRSRRQRFWTYLAAGLLLVLLAAAALYFLTADGGDVAAHDSMIDRAVAEHMVELEAVPDAGITAAVAARDAELEAAHDGALDQAVDARSEELAAVHDSAIHRLQLQQ